MCTLSWVRHENGYTVFFNRDERRTRSQGLPPTEQMRAGVRFLAPSDPDGGGSWAAVNDRRIGFCILNQYNGSTPQITDPVSRGQLLLSLAEFASQAEVWTRVRSAGLLQYSPFTLAVFEPGLPVLLLGWNGRALTEQTQGQSGFISSSSSVAQVEAEASRRKLFDALMAAGAIEEADFERLHRSHLPEEGPLSVCMHRIDAETVSLTRLSVDAETVSLSYVGGSPCRGAAPVTLRLAVASPAFRIR